MTDHAPIWTRQDLADLVTQHDTEFPDHGDNCDCHNGIIPALRTYFAPIEQPNYPSAKPYVPPDLQQPQDRAGSANRKPWLQQRDNETEQEYDHRISHSCYNCGEYIVDRAALNAHEDQCRGGGKICSEA